MCLLRAVALQWEEFQQIRGARFTHDMIGSALVPSRTNRRLSRAQLDQARALMPVTARVPLQHLQGPSDLYAILMDQPVRMSGRPRERPEGFGA